MIFVYICLGFYVSLDYFSLIQSSHHYRRKLQNTITIITKMVAPEQPYDQQWNVSLYLLLLEMYKEAISSPSFLWGINATHHRKKPTIWTRVCLTQLQQWYYHNQPTVNKPPISPRLYRTRRVLWLLTRLWRVTLFYYVTWVSQVT